MNFLFQIFPANYDQHVIVRHRLRHPILGRYFRFHPITWYSWISMRVELYGCVVGEFGYHLRLLFFPPLMVNPSISRVTSISRGEISTLICNFTNCHGNVWRKMSLYNKKKKKNKSKAHDCKRKLSSMTLEGNQMVYS